MQKDNGGGYNGNGNSHHDDNDRDKEESNIIRIPTLAERDKIRREQEKEEQRLRKQYRKAQAAAHGPMINLPPVTKYALAALFLVHLVMQGLLSPIQQYGIIENLGFIPARYTGAEPFSFWALIGPFSFVLFHGSWTHLLLNGFMLMAFGSGMERWIGAKRMLVFFFLCSLASALAHLLLNPFSSAPVIGASGGLSGMFAAILILMQQRGVGMMGRYGVWPFVALWIGISVILGMIEAPGGGTVAWAAHIGGFLAGFVFLKPVLKYIR